MSRAKLSPVVVRLGWVSFFTDAASEMLFPIIPLFLTVTLGAPVASVGIIEGVADGISTGLRALSGWLSDRYRRNKAQVVLGYTISALSKPLIALAGAWGYVAALRAADRVGKAIRNAPRDVMIADATAEHDRGRAFGFHRAMDTAGAVLGPLIAIAFLLAFGREQLRPLFLVALVPGVASLLLLVRLPESRRPAGHEWEGGRLPWRGPYGRFVAVSVLFGIGNSSDAFLLLRAKDLGLSVIAVVAAYAVYNTTYAALSYPAGRLSDRRSRIGIFGTGLIVFAAVYAAFGVIDSPAMAWPLFLVYGAYMALTDGVGRAIVVDLVPATLRGRALGVWQALYGGSVLVAGVTAGVLWDAVSPRTPFLVGGSTAAVAAVVLLAGVRRAPVGAGQ